MLTWATALEIAVAIAFVAVAKACELAAATDSTLPVHTRPCQQKCLLSHSTQPLTKADAAL